MNGLLLPYFAYSGQEVSIERRKKRFDQADKAFGVI
jgi:hypothetical protein